MESKKDKILPFIKDFIKRCGYSPSIRDICEGLDINSTSHVKYSLDELEESGHITRVPGASRTIRVAERR